MLQQHSFFFKSLSSMITLSLSGFSTVYEQNQSEGSTLQLFFFSERDEIILNENFPHLVHASTSESKINSIDHPIYILLCKVLLSGHHKDRVITFCLDFIFFQSKTAKKLNVFKEPGIISSE